MCDCASDEDSEPKVQARRQPVDDKKPCDCTSEDDSEDKAANADEPCDCTSESSGPTSDTCDCTSEGSSARQMQQQQQCADLPDDQPESSPFAIVQVELSKSMLDLMPSSESSSTSCDCTTSRSQHSSQPLPTCSSSKDEPSCDCTSESSAAGGSSSSGEEARTQWTLAIVKPEAAAFRAEIERIAEQEGFAVCRSRRLQLTAEQASEFYRDNYEQKDLARLIAYMSSGPIAVYVLCKLQAITEWRLLIGPTKVSAARLYAPDSIRGRFGVAGDEMRNAVHGSFDERAAKREIHFFFPDCILEPVLSDEAAESYLWRRLTEVLSEGLAKCCEERPDDPLLWLGNWLLDGRRPEYL